MALHRWTYNTSGELIGAPHFEIDPCLNRSEERRVGKEC